MSKADSRPDPDELLERVQEEERKRKRGRLTIFFGAAPGVGKTFAMLQEAERQRDLEGRDVVAGVVETHGRFETTTMFSIFERLPKRAVAYRGTTLEEFDLDGALARKPGLILVDELAHTNAAGSRHAKRWQDVQELLEAGIDVYATLNVQHVESLNDVIAQITGVRVRETVPDSVLDAADEIKLVDLTPDELLERLREGKVYVPATAERAIENFFRKGNLIALRELALRKMAERVDADMLAWRKAQGIEKTWAASDRLLVCIGPSPYSANLLRAGRRMAASLGVPWFAVHVESSAMTRLPAADRARISQNLRLAERLGADAVTLAGEGVAKEILRFAREKNVTKIIVGKPRVRRLRDRIGTSFVDELTLESGDIDIYATAGEGDGTPGPAPVAPREVHPISGYLAAVATVMATTVGALLLFGRDQPADVVMTYLLGIVVISTQFGFRASVGGAFLSVVSFNFFFVPPYLTFAVTDARHVVTFGVMLLVAVVIAGLTQRVRERAEAAGRSERRTAMLYALSRDLSQTQGRDALTRVAATHVERAFDSRVAVFVEGEGGATRAIYATPHFDAPVDGDAGVVRWVMDHGREAGLGTDTLAGAGGLYIPLIASGTERDVLGVLGMYPADRGRLDDPEQRRLADAFVAQTASALERGRLAEEMERAHVEVEAEQLRSTLLSSVSHDLRTPLAVMKGAASTLLDDEGELNDAARKDLAGAIVEETDRLERLVRNLLDMTRLESGGVRIRKEWTSVEEVVGAALGRVEGRLAGREVHTDVPGDLAAPFDGVLVEQVLVNLMENAAKYTPAGSPIDVSARKTEEEVVVTVADRGPGIPVDQRSEVFEKFRRGRTHPTQTGVGLGLAICRASITAHGGRIWVDGRSGGGSSFCFALPLDARPPPSVLPEIDEKVDGAAE